MKTKISQLLLQTKEISKKNILSYILTNEYFYTNFESIRELVETYSALPCSNAEVQRGFSAMKRIKTLNRNRLLIRTLNSVMMISFPTSKGWCKQNIHVYINYWHQTFNFISCNKIPGTDRLCLR